MITSSVALPSWQMLSITVMVVWVALARASLLVSRLRSSLQPFVAKQVENGVQTVLLLQRFQHRSLDAIFGLFTVLVSKEFYTIFLPFLFWSGNGRLARQMTLLMAFSIYIGNCVKDTVSAPRPPCPPVRRFTATGSEKDFALEYGLPSSHTINTICLSGYLLMHMLRVLDLRGIYVVLLVLFFVSISVITIVGRLYLGMHTPIDILAGVLIGTSLLAFWSCIDESLDSFITKGSNVESFWGSISFLLLFAYPTPEMPTPSFEFHTAFDGVALGVVMGVHRTFSQYHHEGVANLISLESGLNQLVKRLIIGYPLVLGVKVMFKELAKLLLPTICACFGLPVKSSTYNVVVHQQDTPLKDDGKSQDTMVFGARRLTSMLFSAGESCDIDTGIRLIQYAGLGWSVAELAPYLFEFVHI